MDFVDDYLEHYGTKGMKWGVRNNLQIRTLGTERGDYLVKKDAKFHAKFAADPKIAKMSRIAATDSKKQISKLKQEYKDAGHNVKKNGLHQTRYDAEVSAILKHSLERASEKTHGRSGSGLLQVTVHRHPNGEISAAVGHVELNAKLQKQQLRLLKYDAKRANRSDKNNLIRDTLDTNFNAKHPLIAAYGSPRRRKITASTWGAKVALNLATGGAASLLGHSDLTHSKIFDFANVDELDFRLLLDEEGFVSDVFTAFDDKVELEQSDLNTRVDEVIKHYGIKGMHWGVRKQSSPRPAFMSSVAKNKNRPKWQSAPNKKTGELVPTASAPKRKFGLKPAKPKLVSEDAAKFRELRVKVKAEGIQSLTNKDISTVMARAELMSKYNKAYPKPKSPLAKAANVAVDVILSDIGSKKLVDLIGAPTRRSPSKDKQAETVANLLKVAQTVRKVAKPEKAK